MNHELVMFMVFIISILNKSLSDLITLKYCQYDIVVTIIIMRFIHLKTRKSLKEVIINFIS